MSSHSNDDKFVQIPEQINYQQLQTCIDRFIGKFGLAKSINILNQLTGDSGIEVIDINRQLLVKEYIIKQCVKLFNLDHHKFKESTEQTYREARMACYHLIKKYTKESYAAIVRYFGCRYHNIYYNERKCEEILQLPAYYKVFSDIYNQIEHNTVAYITSLNN